MEELELAYDPETGTWGKKEEPFATIEVQTEKDFELLEKAVAYWHEHHDEEGNEI